MLKKLTTQERLFMVADAIEQNWNRPFGMQSCDRCFLGWVARETGTAFSTLVEGDPAFNQENFEALCCPTGWREAYNTDRTKAAAILRRFAMGEEISPNWLNEPLAERVLAPAA